MLGDRSSQVIDRGIARTESVRRLRHADFMDGDIDHWGGFDHSFPPDFRLKSDAILAGKTRGEKKLSTDFESYPQVVTKLSTGYPQVRNANIVTEVALVTVNLYA